jgi:hypothetical protein
MTQGQQTASFLTKLGITTLGGTPGAFVGVVDVIAELLTGRGLIDRAWAATDNPRTGGTPTGFGAYAQGGHEPTLSALKADQKRTVDKYLKPTTPKTTTTAPTTTAPVDTYVEDKTFRPTPTQLWGPQNKYSEFKYATS